MCYDAPIPYGALHKFYYKNEFGDYKNKPGQGDGAHLK